MTEEPTRTPLPANTGSPPGTTDDEMARCAHCGSTNVDTYPFGVVTCVDCGGSVNASAAGVDYKQLPEGWTPGEELPIEYLRDTGLLWLINRVVFHPRGFALALRYDNNTADRKVVGFELQGDGSEVWNMNPPGGGAIDEDALFGLVERFIDLHRLDPPPVPIEGRDAIQWRDEEWVPATALDAVAARGPLRAAED